MTATSVSPTAGRPAPGFFGTTPRQDAATTLAALAALLAWDGSGADMAVTRLFAGTHGFALRDNLWTSTLAHDGGRLMAWALLLVLVVAALRAPLQPGMPGLQTRGLVTPGAAPGRAERLRWLGVMLLCALAVPLLKRGSVTSCPWDLAEFGGTARYVSHWAFAQRDGGPGHCFPSGHAVAAFSFFGLYFQWRGHDPRRARRWLAGVMAVGALFGAAQLARGAHHVSHTLWSAWFCWALCVLAATAFRRRAWARA